MDAFIASHKQPPRELVLDIDATHVPLHGAQQRAHFHYDNYCYLPLYVFAGQALLACVLRPSDREPAKVLSALIKLLAAKLRRAWPQVRLIVRADSGFCRPRALRRFDAWGIHYIIGLAKNEALINTVALAQLALAERHRSRPGGSDRHKSKRRPRPPFLFLRVARWPQSSPGSGSSPPMPSASLLSSRCSCACSSASSGASSRRS